MDEETIKIRLAAAGIAAASSLGVAATIRSAPGGDHAAAETVVAAAGTPPRGLPRLSVDLGTEPTRTTSSPPPPDGADLEVVGVIGQGGMGRVLLARQHSLLRDVAVKTARDDAPREARDAILSEGAFAGQLEHPSIVPVHALGVDGRDRPALVMKRIEGVGWDGLLANPAHEGWEGWDGDERDRLPGHLQILVSVCNAIHFAHSRGIVHRDIKPSNVLIGRYGDVYVADWGVATRMGGAAATICGTPGYMAPEMVEGGPLDARTDVYLLGATLHLVLTGRLRHPGEDLVESLLRAQRSEPFEYGDGVPRELADLANRACSADPADRPATAQAFRDEIARHVRHRQAREIAEQAMRRAAELEVLLVLDAPDDEQRQRIERLLAEARFGLEQALAQWSENAPARRALDRIEAIVRERSARTTELERDARERDPTVGRGARTTALALVTLAVAGIALTLRGEPTALQLVFYSVGMIALLLVVGVALRRRILGTRFDREVIAAVTVVTAIMMAGRLVGLVAPVPVHHQLARDSFVIAGAAGVVAIAYLRWAAWVAALFAVTGILCSVSPSRAAQIFSWANVLVMGLATLWSWRPSPARGSAARGSS